MFGFESNNIEIIFQTAKYQSSGFYFTKPFEVKETLALAETV